MYDALIIGGGPAGLRAAELVSQAGISAVLADQMPSFGRKLLVAGKGGLNLTHSEPVENFPARYGDMRWKSLLEDFSPGDLRAWAESLGIETFIGTSGRVFPLGKQAAPLLRRWVERLRVQKVSFCLRHSFISFQKTADGSFETAFTTSQGHACLRSHVIILAMGGGSWPQTGSDGAWVSSLRSQNVKVAPLVPANSGYEVEWPVDFLRETEGLPLKNIVVRAENQSIEGELLITRYGLEGGALYQLGRQLRSMSHPQLTIDFKPTFRREQLIAKISATPKPDSILKKAAHVWRLSPAVQHLLKLRGSHISVTELATLVKAYPLSLQRPRPLAEAISSAGGVAWNELTDELMLKQWPGIFCAGEMIDWEAPTGGYLLQGCFSTAARAARGALRFCK